MKLLMCLFLFFASPWVFAQGSVEWREVEYLLREQPDFAHALDDWDLEPSGEGIRISYRMSPALAGRYVGSYTFPARSKDGTKIAHVQLETDTVFLDRDGKIVAEVLANDWIYGDDIWLATEIREKLSGLTMVEDEGATPPVPSPASSRL